MELSKSQIAARARSRKKAEEMGWGLSNAVIEDLRQTFQGEAWNSDAAFAVFEKIEGFDGNVRKFEIVDRSYLPWLRGRRGWVKPDFELVKQAASEKKALCVNKDGRFDLKESGFVALSHVWAEGLYADSENRGLPLYVLDQLFERLKCVEEADWVWIDSLAVPGGDRDLSVEEEKVKVDLINAMGSIYSNAHIVIVLDALMLRLTSTDPVDIAFCLLCGRWRTRMWTYQEGRLASHLRILTAVEPVDFLDLIKKLIALDESQQIKNVPEGNGEILDPANPQLEARYVHGIILQLQAMFDLKDLDLWDLWRTCYVREAGQDIDYARALFPAAGLTWSERYGRDQGMAVIYELYRRDAVNFLLSFGAPRLIEGPGWVPSYLNHLDIQRHPPAQWTPRGVQSTWYPYKIRSARRHAGQNEMLNIECDQGEDREFVCDVWTSSREYEKARIEFINAVDSGNGLVLASTPLEVMRNKNNGSEFKIIILAKQTEISGEVQVIMTCKIFWLEKSYDVRKSEFLLSHKNPLNHQATDEENIVLQRTFNTDMSIPTENDNNLFIAHSYITVGNVEALRKLLEEDISIILNCESAGWTLVHWAVAAQSSSEEMIKMLLDYGLDPDGKFSPIQKTPLILALEKAQDSVITLLLDQGASQRSVKGVSPLTQALYSRRSPEIIDLLIENGANVHVRDDFGRTPLFYSKDSRTLERLLKAGADPLSRLPNGRSALHIAAIEDSSEIIRQLIQFGAPVDMLERGSEHTPLYYAIINQNKQSVRTLIEEQSNVNRRCKDGLTLLMHTVQIGNFSTTEDLLRAGALVDVASSDEHKWTPLHFAIRAGDSRLLNLLLERPDCDTAVWRKDSKGLIAADLAKLREKTSMVTMIRRRASRSDSNFTAGFVFISVTVIVQLFQYYLAKVRKCELPDRAAGAVSGQAHEHEKRTLLQIALSPAFALFHLIFSTRHLILKSFVICAGIVALQGNVKKRRYKKKPELKQLEWAWKNQREYFEERLTTLLGVVIILATAAFIVSLLLEAFELRITVVVTIVAMSLFVLWAGLSAPDEDGAERLITWLGFGAMLSPIWILTACYAGWLSWRTACTVMATPIQAFLGGLFLIEQFRIQLDDSRIYSFKKFGLDAGIFIFLTSFALYYGWPLQIVMFLNLGVSLYAYDYFCVRVGWWPFPSQPRGRQLGLTALSGLLGLCGLLLWGSWIDQIVIITAVLHILIVALLNYILTKVSVSLDQKTSTNIVLGWISLTEVAIRYGWRRGGIISGLISVFLVLDQVRRIELEDDEEEPQRKIL